MSKIPKDSWIADPRGGGNDKVARTLIDRRNEIELLGEVTDAEADYSFDDWALVRLDSKYYLLNTAGYYCPDPAIEWGVVLGPATLDEVRTYLIDATGERGFGVTLRQHKEFMDMVEKAKSAELVYML